MRTIVAVKITITERIAVAVELALTVERLLLTYVNAPRPSNPKKTFSGAK